MRAPRIRNPGDSGEGLGRRLELELDMEVDPSHGCGGLDRSKGSGSLSRTPGFVHTCCRDFTTEGVSSPFCCLTDRYHR